MHDNDCVVYLFDLLHDVKTLFLFGVFGFVFE